MLRLCWCWPVGYRRGVMNMTTITAGLAGLFSLEIAGVFALEIVGQRRARRRAEFRALPDPKPARPVFLIEDDDGRTRVFARAPQLKPLGALPDLNYLSSGLMNLKVSPATRAPNTSATR